MQGYMGQYTAAVLGIPVDFNSSFLQGAALAPAKIRQVLHSGSSNWFLQDGRDLQELVWQDLGDLEPPSDPKAAADFITEQVNALLWRGAKLLTLGGDHSITFPVVRAFAAHHPLLTIVHIDAHSDLYEEFDANFYSHASPFARIMEAKLVKRLVQIGLRTPTRHEREQAARFGVEMIQAQHWTGLLPKLDGPLYISLDLDALDPAFAPGVSHHEPGGLSVREVLSILGQIQAPVVGADLVELNPTRDHADTTAAVAAKFYKELLGKML
jgi:arginase